MGFLRCGTVARPSKRKAEKVEGKDESEENPWLAENPWVRRSWVCFWVWDGEDWMISGGTSFETLRLECGLQQS